MEPADDIADWVVSEVGRNLWLELYDGSNCFGCFNKSKQLEIKPIISSRHGNRHGEMAPYLYGDEIAEIQGQVPIWYMPMLQAMLMTIIL